MSRESTSLIASVNAGSRCNPILQVRLSRLVKNGHSNPSRNLPCVPVGQKLASELTQHQNHQHYYYHT